MQGRTEKNRQRGVVDIEKYHQPAEEKPGWVCQYGSILRNGHGHVLNYDNSIYTTIYILLPLLFHSILPYNNPILPPHEPQSSLSPKISILAQTPPPKTYQHRQHHNRPHRRYLPSSREVNHRNRPQSAPLHRSLQKKITRTIAFVVSTDE